MPPLPSLENTQKKSYKPSPFPDAFSRFLIQSVQFLYSHLPQSEICLLKIHLNCEAQLKWDMRHSKQPVALSLFQG